MIKSLLLLICVVYFAHTSTRGALAAVSGQGDSDSHSEWFSPPPNDIGQLINNHIQSLNKRPGTITIPGGNYTLSTEISLASNVGIDCSSNTVIAASPTFNKPMIGANGIKHFRLKGCTLDANRRGNSHHVEILEVVNSDEGEISGNHFRNTNSRALWISDNNSHIRIENNEIDHFGDLLPASIGSEGIAIAPSGPTPGNSNIIVSGNRIHDGNIGMGIYTSSDATKLSSDIEVTDNFFYSNANDGFLIYSQNASGAPIRNVRIYNNESYCNGWPSKGKGFSENCTGGFLQTGTQTSGTGAGFNLNSSLLERAQVVGNTSHDNYFEGFDNTPQRFAVVDTKGMTVIWAGGDPFIPEWKPNQGVRINGVDYLISAVAGANSTLTLTTSAGNQSKVQLVGMSYSRALIMANTAYNNGRGNNSSSGHGFSDAAAYGTTYAGNNSYDNQGVGFFDQLSTSTTHSGDKSWNNDLGGGFSAGFYCGACLEAGYFNVRSDDFAEIHHQRVAIVLDSHTSRTQISAIDSLRGLVLDTGTDNTLQTFGHLSVETKMNFGSNIGNQVLTANSTNRSDSYALELNIYQVKVGVNCGPEANTVALQYTFTDPTNTTHRNVTGPELTIHGNGAVGMYENRVVSIPVSSNFQTSWNTISHLNSAGCTVLPQYQVSVKLVG